MFISCISKNGFHFECFETEREAAEWVCSKLGADYANDFWVDYDGALVQSDRKMFDFSADVFNCPASVFRDIENMDDEVMIIAIKAFVEAFQRWLKK